MRGALRRLVDRHRVTVLVNPADLELVSDAWRRLRAELGGIEQCDVQADRRVGRGGVVVAHGRRARSTRSIETQLAGPARVVAEQLSRSAR